MSLLYVVIGWAAGALLVGFVLVRRRKPPGEVVAWLVLWPGIVILLGPWWLVIAPPRAIAAAKAWRRRRRLGPLPEARTRRLGRG